MMIFVSFSEEVYRRIVYRQFSNLYLPHSIFDLRSIALIPLTYLGLTFFPPRPFYHYTQKKRKEGRKEGQGSVITNHLTNCRELWFTELRSGVVNCMDG